MIVLRGANKLPEAYSESAMTERMRRELMEFNEFLEGFPISLDHPDALNAGIGVNAQE